MCSVDMFWCFFFCFEYYIVIKGKTIIKRIDQENTDRRQIVENVGIKLRKINIYWFLHIEKERVSPNADHHSTMIMRIALILL